MSMRIMTQVWERSQHKGSELLLMLAIADNANDQGLAYPSTKTLAKKTRLSNRQVQRLIRVVTRSRELEVSVGIGPRGCNEYRIHLGGDKMSPDEIIRGGIQGTKRGDTAMSPEPTTQTEIALTREQLKRSGLTPGSKIWDLLTGKIGPDAPF
jgi:Helix-turn-helix domain